MLKIDIEFVRDLLENPENQHVVKAIVNLAQGFGRNTIAEGVEDEATLELLEEYGVDCAQGFAIGRPAPIDLRNELPSARTPTPGGDWCVMNPPSGPADVKRLLTRYCR